MIEALRQKRIKQTIKRAKEQELDVSAKILVECLFDLSDDEDSDNSLDGDCCLKDLANTQEQKQTEQTGMASVDKEKIHKKKKEIIYHKKGGTTKTKEAKWTHKFSTEKKKANISNIDHSYNSFYIVLFIYQDRFINDSCK